MDEILYETGSIKQFIFYRVLSLRSFFLWKRVSVWKQRTMLYSIGVLALVLKTGLLLTAMCRDAAQSTASEAHEAWAFCCCRVP